MTELTGDSLKLSGAYGPAAQKWHTITFNVNGRSRYYAHDKVTRLAGAAVFDVRIPIPIGRNRVTVTAEGADPATFIANRAAPARPHTVDHDKHESKVEKQRRERDSQTEPSKYLDKHRYYLHEKMGYAMNCFKAEQYVNARAILQEVVDEWPGPADIKQAKMQERFAEDWKKCNEYILKVAFRQGDVKGMGDAGEQYLKYERLYYDRYVADGTWPKGNYGFLAKTYERFLDDYILLGGDKAVISKLCADWVAIRRRLGKADEQYEKKRFRYLQEPF